ncbi:site-specific integrase [Dellaglioa carnosa]|uniref:Site-specific integrase n=1 Tax=Dellaglioa carnosa TaxID=2995136 RepID=A0ABT4JNH0_9LACO|nr:site-specific integrase [Dellaglioa carnosa]MCZ2491906.1 site-specific integrase [Dellaglioa carnosa]MCZ2495057.1 site-specific integrase [Dellaglioa carnosa]MDK1731920.1 site-specific integrase [Dellaglioa carnosa]
MLQNVTKIKNYAGLVFKEAKRLKIIYDNPIELVILPKKPTALGEEKFENFWDINELRTFFTHLNTEYSGTHDKVIALFRLLAFTGMRKGEALALQFTDFDFINNTVTINKTVTRAVDNHMVIGTPKTVKSFRTIDIDVLTSKIIQKWQNTQRKEMLMLGFNTNNTNQLVFPNKDNMLLNVTKPNKWLDHIISKYDLKHITVHGLRHTACALLFESGATIKQVQERLGHSNAETTLNIYAHVSKYAKKETADKFAKYVNF